MAQQMDDVIFVAPDQHAVLKRPEQLEGRHRHLDVEEVHKLDGAVSSIQRPCHVNR